MKITAISIFPEYFAPLELSLIGKARNQSLIDFAAINLRDFTHDNHHTVDDTPYGGGAGMVMKPEPWGEAIDSVIAKGSTPIDLVILTPAGKKFTQRVAEEMVGSEHLLFACGRYEGIDARVAVIVVGLGVSNSFILPTHQVNALYMGPGEYQSRDYIKIGGFLSLIYIVVLVAMTYVFYL